MSRSAFIIILISFSQLYSYSQHVYAFTRDQVIKYGIEKVVITKKDRMGFTKTTYLFDKKGNVTTQKYLGDYYKEFKPEFGPSQYIEITSFYHDDTVWTKSIHKAGDHENPGKYIIDTNFIQRKFNSNGKVYLTIETSSASPDLKYFTHYNKYGLEDTFRVLTNEEFSAVFPEKNKRIVFDDFYINQEIIYTYDSLKRLETMYEDLPGSRTLFSGPIIHKYSYNNDTIVQKDYRLKDSILIPENTFRKSYANKNYLYEETHYDTTEIFITNNSFGLPLKEKQKSRRKSEGITFTEASYEYFFRNPAMKKN